MTVINVSMDTLSKEFPELFHYMNVHTFKDIYNKKNLRATHYQDLNDSSEFMRFNVKVCELIRTEILKILNKNRRGNNNAVVDEETKGFMDMVHSHTFHERMYKETFILSFCGHTNDYEVRNGLLSQWRGYGGGNSGIAIVLDTESIKKMGKCEVENYQLQEMHMGDVVYDNNDARIKDDFKDVFEHVLAIVELTSSGGGEKYRNEIESYFIKMHNHYLLGSTLVKHHAFHEENEIR